ncbi:hypothetical protein Sste5346_007571 [Sporothrix stenoceras]|uniref:Intradiol ring-cleavage dioxygenases domain-containing protein n=1 Tax=Sporothrix stenoceras TaxID=5173 RepID=A0ABR3YUH5_9PEZI
MRSFATVTVAALSLLSGALAHPGEDHDNGRITVARDLAAAHAREIMAKCSGTAPHAALQARSAARRALTAQLLREERDIAYTLEKWMGKCHDHSSHDSAYNASTPEATIFTSNATHALTPENIVGPYYVKGELLRRNITEDQAGVPVHLDIQFIDITTCQPVPNLLVDVWQANATGVYSGVVASGGLNTTFLRGFQISDHEGVVEFDTLYPGHYFGRTQHIHVITRRGGTVLPNNTYTGGTVNHIGQLYFDQELSNEVETMAPYLYNYMPVTYNSEDIWTAEAASAEYDPFLDYVKLSDDANDGLLMWITIGINGTADYENQATAAATWQKDGGVAAPMPAFPFPFPPRNVSNGTFPVGNGTFPGFNGTFPFNGTEFPGGTFPGFGGPKKGGKTPKPWGPCENEHR